MKITIEISDERVRRKAAELGLADLPAEKSAEAVATAAFYFQPEGIAGGYWASLCNGVADLEHRGKVAGCSRVANEGR